ncbi:hypothetical protein F5888DRAFT_1711332, partial [Russula emetica]
PVSYSPCSLAFTFILYHSSHARRAWFCSTRLASCLLLHLSPQAAYFFISPEKNSPSLPFSPPSIVHCTILCLTRPRTCTCTTYEVPISSHTLSSIDCFISIGAGFAPLAETILHAQKKERFVLGARGGHVACATEMRDRATLNALVEDSLKKSTEGHHDAFARVEPDCWVLL